MQLRIPRGYVFFGLAALSLMMFSIDSTVVAVALPTVMGDLHTSLAWTGWTLTAYTLTQITVMPLAGKLSESFGRMRVFLACVVLFTVGSLLCGLAPNIYVLIGCRVLQALGGGGFLPSAAGIVAREFPRERARMIGLFSSIFPLGGIIGPNLGGLIVEHWSWRQVFLINVPIGALVLLVLWRQARTPETRAQRNIDVVGAVLFASAITALLLALSMLGNDPTFWSSPLFGGLLVGSALLLAAFGWQELRVAEPVLDLRLVMRSPFLAVNVYNFWFGACVFGFFAFIPYFAVVQFGMSPAESGAVLTPRSVVMMATSMVVSLLLVRVGYRAPMIAGMALIVVSLELLSQGWGSWVLGSARIGTFPLLALEVGLAGMGMGLAAPSSNNAILDLLPERAAVVTGIRGMFRSTGGVIGTACIVLGLQFSPDKAAGLRVIFGVLGGLLLLTLPLTLLIPDTARGRRRPAQPAQGEPSAPDGSVPPRPATLGSAPR